MAPKVGLYFITRVHGLPSICQYTRVDADGGNSARFIESFAFFEDAVRKMYELNGWGEPKGGFRFGK